MKNISVLLAFLIIVGICIPAASANEIYNETFTYSSSDYISVTSKYSGSVSGHQPFNCIAFTNNVRSFDIKQIICQAETTAFYSPPTDTAFWPVSFTDTSGQTIGEGTFYYFPYKVGSTNYFQCVIDIDYIDLTSSSSLWVFLSSAPAGKAYPQLKYTTTGTKWPDDIANALNTDSPSHYVVMGYEFTSVGEAWLTLQVHPSVKWTTTFDQKWQNQIIITESGVGTEFNLNRDFDGNTFSSMTVDTNLGSRLQSLNKNTSELYYLVDEHYPINVTLDPIVTSPYYRTIDLGGPDEPVGPGSPVTVYVRNSQTGAAIANSRIVIDALVDGEYHPVVNRTEPSGIFSVTLYPTGGGIPNPDGYRLIASADGYINPLPEINFTVDEYTTSIYCYLDPIAGGPLDENKTFIDFFVRDMSANPISGATINFGGYTMITNSAGYAVLEVGKNATYTYTVSKSGYGSLTGNVVIGVDPRHTINTVLAPAVTPITQTPIPTGTAIGATPTIIAPTGEPVSNWLEWFAAHFGMILGGGVEIGKIFMWLCFTVPVGVYVGKESKAGAAGFMAGAGIVTLFFVLIEWVPIWLVVLIALIIGLLYAKVFNTPDNGGGR